MTTGSSWAHRYGPNHRRLCARPGCGAPAAATLRFQPTQREAWLVDLEDDAARTEGDLCARHAAGLVLPRGWQLHNGLTNARTEKSTATPPAPRRRRAPARPVRRRRVQTGTVELPGMSAEPGGSPELRLAPEPVPEVDVVPEAAVVPETNVVPETDAAATEPRPETAPPPPAPPEPAPLVAPATAEESEALAETLDAQTPLLRRAFANVWLPEADS